MTTADRSSDSPDEVERVRRRIESGEYVVDAMDVADAILRVWSMRDVVEAFEEAGDDAPDDAGQSAATSG